MNSAKKKYNGYKNVLRQENKPSLTTCIKYQERLGINKRYMNTLKNIHVAKDKFTLYIFVPLQWDDCHY